MVSEVVFIAEDFAAIFYGKTPKYTVFTHRDVYEGFFKFLEKKDVDSYILTKAMHKYPRPLKTSYIQSAVNPNQFHWRITVNLLSLEKDKLVTISLSPEAKQSGLIANKEHVKNLALRDLPYFKSKIGSEFILNIGKDEVNFSTFSFSDCEIIDIGNWTVNLSPDKSISYSNYASNKAMVLQEIKKKQLTFRLINLSIRDNSRNSQILKEEFTKLGTVIGPILDSSYATKLSMTNQDPRVMYVILSETDQEYFDSKQFFLNRGLPFQHIRNISKFSNEQFIRDMVLLEIIKKIEEESLYLRPDIFQNSQISGFIYIDDAVKKDTNNAYTNFLNISYTFTDSRNFTSERIFVYSKDEIPFYSSKKFLSINNTDTLANKVREDAEIGGNGGQLFDIIVTKQITIKNAGQISESLKKRGIIVNKIYYVSNNACKFADNFNALSLNEVWKHSFIKLAENIALVKLATRPFLLPQMFSTLLKIVYPENANVEKEDVSKVIWLTKKRLYRIYNLPNMTLLEPVVIRRKNSEFLVDRSRKFYWLRHLI